MLSSFNFLPIGTPPIQSSMLHFSNYSPPLKLLEDKKILHNKFKLKNKNNGKYLKYFIQNSNMENSTISLDGKALKKTLKVSLGNLKTILPTVQKHSIIFTNFIQLNQAFQLKNSVTRRKTHPSLTILLHTNGHVSSSLNNPKYV